MSDLRGNVKELLLDHVKKYPLMKPRDLIKLVHQSAFGCEHLISSKERALEYILEEKRSNSVKVEDYIENIGGGYSRVYLSCIDDGLCPRTLASIFHLSSKCEKTGIDTVKIMLSEAITLANEGCLPFSHNDLLDEIDQWEKAGYTAVHHSAEFREAYSPAYRVIASKFVKILPVLQEIDKMLENRNIVLAIDGGSASGKSTLAAQLNDIYESVVLHIDDFFLRPEQRTAKRLATAGGNFDRERFLAEVLIPLSHGNTAAYRKFDCSTGSILPAKDVYPAPLIIVEGAYSMHPELQEFYDLSLFLDIDPELQKIRINKRNSKEMAERFFGEWIPLEHKYFDKFDIQNSCTLRVKVVD